MILYIVRSGHPPFAALLVLYCCFTAGDFVQAGVILYIILSGHPPFDQSAPIPALFNSILNARYSFPREQWEGVSEDAKDLVKRMLMVDTDARLQPHQILQHPWMLGFHSDDLNKECLGMQQRLQEWQATKRLKAAINASTLTCFTSC